MRNAKMFIDTGSSNTANDCTSRDKKAASLRELKNEILRLRPCRRPLTKAMQLGVYSIDFPISGGWFSILETTFWNPESTFWGSRGERSQQRRHLWSQGWIFNGFWRIWVLPLEPVLEHLANFQWLCRPKFQHRFSGRFSPRFWMQIWLKSDGQMCWNHSKYVSFR